MSERELAQLFGRASREIDAMQRARIRELMGAERELFEAMARRIVDAIDQGGGTVSTRMGSASINRMVDEAFRAIEKGNLKAFYQQSLGDLFRILAANDIYGAALFRTVSRAGDARYKQIRAQVDRSMRARIGIDDKGRSIKGGYFDDLLGNVSQAVKAEIKTTLNAGVNAGIPMGRLLRQVEISIKGTRAIPGALTKALQSHVFDTYQAFDREASKTYAVKLGLDTFVYQGGLIETSREFCIKRNGKVFTLDEAEEWRCDKDLPKKKAEGSCAGAYNPTQDMGRWNCRHRVRFISRAMAEQLRTDLAK